MFTGIITGVGQVLALRQLGASHQHGQRVTLAVPHGYLADVGLGDSVALNGACMTAVALRPDANEFDVDVSAESLARTCGLNRVGQRVNLEKAVRPMDRLGGHIVSGHVDGVGQVTRFEAVGESWALEVLAPVTLAPYLAYKGSVAINGVSLTLNAVNDGPQGCTISINLIPHTVHHTALADVQTGDAVNLEVDTVARYVCRYMALTTAAATATPATGAAPAMAMPPSG